MRTYTIRPKKIEILHVSAYNYSDNHYTMYLYHSLMDNLLNYVCNEIKYASYYI